MDKDAAVALVLKLVTAEVEKTPDDRTVASRVVVKAFEEEAGAGWEEQEAALGKFLRFIKDHPETFVP